VSVTTPSTALSRLVESSAGHSSSNSRESETIRKGRRTKTRAASPSSDFASTRSRLAQVPSSNCHIFHQIPRVVVLSVLSRTRPFELAPWARHPTASLTRAASERDKNRQNTIRMLSVVRLHDRECDRASFWIRVLLQVCVQPRRETWDVSCYACTSTYVGPTEGACMTDCRVDRWMRTN
jgi:hypothetical protein